MQNFRAALVTLRYWSQEQSLEQGWAAFPVEEDTLILGKMQTMYTLVWTVSCVNSHSPQPSVFWAVFLPVVVSSIYTSHGLRIVRHFHHVPQIFRNLSRAQYISSSGFHRLTLNCLSPLLIHRTTMTCDFQFPAEGCFERALCRATTRTTGTRQRCHGVPCRPKAA